MHPIRSLICLFALAATSISSRAELVWKANFESYTAGASLTINHTGNDDTFSAVNSATGSKPVVVTETIISDPKMSNNSLRVVVTNTSAANVTAAYALLQQYDLPTLGSGVYILSYDVYRGSLSTNPRNGAVTDAGTEVSMQTSALTLSTSVLRETIVINRTGSAIDLPGTLADLADNSIASYFVDGLSTYTLLSTTSFSSSAISGFSTGVYKNTSNITPGNNMSFTVDNMGLWSSVSDINNGISVLSLAPGALIDAVPEPSTFAFGFVAAVSMIVMRRRYVALSR